MRRRLVGLLSGCLLGLWTVSFAALHPVTNFAKATVSTGYDSAATTIVLATGQGAKFPATYPFLLVWWNATDYGDPGDDPSVEIISVTNRSGDTLTITRGQDGTSAANHNTAGKTYLVALTLVRAMWNQIGAEIATGTGGITDVVDASSYASVNAAVTAIGSAVKTLRISNQQVIASNFTAGANITFWCEGGGVLAVNDGVTATIFSPEHWRCDPRRQSISLSGSGKVAWTKAGRVYPNWWGAVADGSTDDAPEVQAAHESLPSTGGTIEYLGGVYKQHAEIAVTKSDIHIKLAPATIIDLTNIAGSGTTGVHNSATVLAGFKFTGSRQRLTGGRITGVPTVSSKNVVGALLHGSTITKLGGIKIDGLYACAWAGTNALDVTLQSVDCDANSWGVLAGYWPTSVGSPQVTRLNLYSVDSHGATIGSGALLYSYVFDTTIVGGHYYSNAQHGIDGYPGAERLAVSGATLSNNTKSGIYLAYGALTGTSAGKLGYARRATLVGNVVYNNTEHNISIHIPDYSLHSTVGGVEDVVLDGNLSQGAGGSCYYLGLVRSSVIGNIARACGNDGFQFLSSQDLTISGNQSWDHGSAGDNRRAYGFYYSPTTGATPPNNTRLAIHGNIGGDSRSGGSRTVNFAFDVQRLDNSALTGNIGRNANTNDWINANGLTAVSFWANSGTCSSCQIGASVAKHLAGSKTWDPASLADGASTSTTVTVTGAAVGDRASCNLTTLTTVQQITAHVTASDTVTTVVRNVSGGTVDMASGTLTCEVWK